MTQNNGGPAFPRTVQHFNGTLEGKDGMTLRDWFAGLAMQAKVTCLGKHSHTKPSEYDECRANTAKSAYAIADAMLAARETQS